MADEFLTATRLKWVYAAVLVIGIGFFFVWGFAFGSFFDFANYTVTVILVFTGLFGTFLYRELEREQALAKASK